MFKVFGYGVAAASLAIIAAEIKFNYSLGDKVHDVYEYLKAKVKGLF